jgi:hypothetical protein
MTTPKTQAVEEARQAALEVLRHNAHGPFRGLPRTAGWGYPEPYTRDLMISALGMLVSDDDRLKERVRRVLEVLAENQTRLGHIPGLAQRPRRPGGQRYAAAVPHRSGAVPQSDG